MYGHFRGARRPGALLAVALALAAFSTPAGAEEPLRPLWKVVEPAGYDPSKAYPLFILLHGANSYLEDMVKSHTLDRRRSDYLLAYIQSTEKAEYAGFTWYREIEKGRREIRQCYGEITGKYRVDAGRVIIGGFSAGGTMAIDVLLNEVIPAAGFVGVSPGRPFDFSTQGARAAAERGVRGVMIAGERDYYARRQATMAAVFDEVGLVYRHVVVPDLGHDYPEDLPQRLDRALEFVDPALRGKTTRAD